MHALRGGLIDKVRLVVPKIVNLPLCLCKFGCIFFFFIIGKTKVKTLPLSNGSRHTHSEKKIYQFTMTKKQDFTWIYCIY